MSGVETNHAGVNERWFAMALSLLELTWIDARSWWLEVGKIEPRDSQGHLLLLGKSFGRWEIDFLWLGLFGVSFS